MLRRPLLTYHLKRSVFRSGKCVNGKHPVIKANITVLEFMCQVSQVQLDFLALKYNKTLIWPPAFINFTRNIYI